MTWAELNEVRDLNKLIQAVEKEIQILSQIPIKPSLPDGMPKVKSISSAVENVLVRRETAEKRLNYLKKMLEVSSSKLERKLDELIADSLCRTIYKFRYVDCMYFRDIGILIGYSEAHIYYLHRITGEKIISDWIK